MAKPLLPDELWEVIRPLIPPHAPQPKGGRPFLDDRKVLTGIIFILKTGLPWEDLPQEMGCGCGMTCWNRLRDWQAAGIWDKIHQLLLAHLRHADKIAFDRFIVDSSHVRAVGGARGGRPQPRGPAKKGQQTPGSHRWPRGALSHRRPPGQHPRCQPSRALGGCCAPYRWEAGTPSPTSGQSHGGPGL